MIFLEEKSMRKFVILLLIVFGMSAGAAWGEFTPTIRIEGSDIQWEKTYAQSDLTQISPTTYRVNDATTNGVFDAEWTLTLDSDPYVMSYISIKNTTSTSQIYTVTFIEPVSPSMSSSIYGGSVGGSLTTDPAGGYISTLAPDPLFLGMIDGVGTLSLYPHPTSWSLPGHGTVALAEQSQWDLWDGPVNSSISIQHKFELSAGDVATLSGYFEVTPEPTTMCLLGLGGLLLRRKRRA
jgi:hypothetical protein